MNLNLIDVRNLVEVLHEAENDEKYEAYLKIMLYEKVLRHIAHDQHTYSRNRALAKEALKAKNTQD